MANYAVVDFLTDQGQLVDVLAAIEVKLETLDSTTNVIRLLTVEQISNGVFIGALVYDG